MCVNADSIQAPLLYYAKFMLLLAIGIQMHSAFDPSGGIQALSQRPTGFLQCFDTVGLVM